VLRSRSTRRTTSNLARRWDGSRDGRGCDCGVQARQVLRRARVHGTQSQNKHILLDALLIGPDEDRAYTAQIPGLRDSRGRHRGRRSWWTQTTATMECQASTFRWCGKQPQIPISAWRWYIRSPVSWLLPSLEANFEVLSAAKCCAVAIPVGWRRGQAPRGRGVTRARYRAAPDVRNPPTAVRWNVTAPLLRWCGMARGTTGAETSATCDWYM
jgi:hypothetical protein